MTMISIIVPAYNAAHFLAQTIESVLAQTVPDWELVIVNDGSQDSTGDIAAQYAARDQRIRVAQQANTGLPGARNRGFEEISADVRFVIFLDADDLWEPETLCHLLAAFDLHPAAVAAHGMARYIDGNSKPIRPGKLEARIRHRRAIVQGRVTDWPMGLPTTFAVLAIDCYIVSAGSVLIRRSALEAVGLFDRMPALPRASLEDWDLWLRLCLRGDIAVAPHVVLNYRQHEANLSQQKKLMFLGEIYVRRKIASLPELSEQQRQTLAVGARSWLATHFRRLAAYQWAAGCFPAATHNYFRYVRLRHFAGVGSPDRVQEWLASDDFQNAAPEFFEKRNRD